MTEHGARRGGGRGLRASPTSTRSAEGPGFRKVRRALGVTAFGVNAIELPAGFETGRHYHEEQEELYFVHRGRIEITLRRRRRLRARPRRPRARRRRDRSARSRRRRRARRLPRGGRQGRLRRPRRQAARGRDEPLRRRPPDRRASGSPSRPESHGSRRARPDGLTAAVAAPALSAAGRPLPGAPRCPLFPADNHWNQRVDRLPVHASSDAIVRSIGLDEHVHADFGSGALGGRPDRDPVRDRRPRPAQACRWTSSTRPSPTRRRYPLPRARADRRRPRRPTATAT